MSGLVASPAHNRVLSSIVGKVELHRENALSALGELASVANPTAPFVPEHIKELRKIGFNTFGALDVRDQLVAGQKIDRLSMENFTTFVKTDEPRRTIVFIPRTSIFVAFDQESHDLANEIKLSASSISDEKLLQFGRIGTCLHRYIDSLRNISSIVDNQVKQGRLDPELALEAKKSLEPFGPLAMNADRIKALSALVSRSKSEFLASFDDETSFFVVALAVVYAEQNPAIIDSHLRKVAEVTQLLARNLDFHAESPRPSGMNAGTTTASGSSLTTTKALLKSPLASESVIPVKYDPRQQRQLITDYLRREFDIDQATCRSLAKYAVRMSLEVSDLQKVHGKLKDKIDYTAKQSRLWGMEGLADSLVEQNPRLLLMTVGEKFDHYSDMLIRTLQTFAQVQSRAEYCDLNPIRQPGRYASVKGLEKLAEAFTQEG